MTLRKTRGLPRARGACGTKYLLGPIFDAGATREDRAPLDVLGEQERSDPGAPVADARPEPTAARSEANDEGRPRPSASRGIGLRLAQLWLVGLVASALAPIAVAGNDIQVTYAAGLVEHRYRTLSGECPDADPNPTELDWVYGAATVTYDPVSRIATFDFLSWCWSGSMLVDGCSTTNAGTIHCYWEELVWVREPSHPYGGYWTQCAVRDLHLYPGTLAYFQYYGFDKCESDFSELTASAFLMVRADVDVTALPPV